VTSPLILPRVLVLDANLFKALKLSGNLPALQVLKSLADDAGYQLVTSPTVFGESVTGKAHAVPRGLLSAYVSIHPVKMDTQLARNMQTEAIKAGVMPRAKADFELFLLAKELAQQHGSSSLVTNDEGIHRLAQHLQHFPGQVQVIEPVQVLTHFIMLCRTTGEEKILRKATKDLAKHFIHHRLQTQRDIDTIITALIGNIRPAAISPHARGLDAIIKTRRILAKAVQGLQLTPQETRDLEPFKKVAQCLREALGAGDPQERASPLSRISTELALAAQTLTPPVYTQLVTEVQPYLLQLHLLQFHSFFQQGDALAALAQLDLAAQSTLPNLTGEGAEALAHIKLIKALLLLAMEQYPQAQELLEECHHLPCPIPDQLPLLQYVASLATTPQGEMPPTPPTQIDPEQLEQVAEDLQYLGNPQLASLIYAALLTNPTTPDTHKKRIAHSLLLCERTRHPNQPQFKQLLTRHLPQQELQDLTNKTLDRALRVTEPTPIEQAPTAWTQTMHVIEAQHSDKETRTRVWHPTLRSRLLIRTANPQPQLLHTRTIRLTGGTIRRTLVNPRDTHQWDVRAIIELEEDIQIATTPKKWWITHLKTPI